MGVYLLDYYANRDILQNNLHANTPYGYNGYAWRQVYGKPWPEKKGRLCYIFSQNIYSLPDHRAILDAEVTCTCLYKGKPVASEEIDSAAAWYLQE